jgi:hypothetical protein
VVEDHKQEKEKLNYISNLKNDEKNNGQKQAKENVN